MYIKIHKKLGREVIAVCDEDLIGKVLDDGEIHFIISEGFYKGEIKTEKEAEEILVNAVNINLVGRESITLALKLKIIEEESIIKIKGVPHAQSLIL